MTTSKIHRKALLAASSVVLAMNAGCDIDIYLPQDHPCDTDGGEEPYETADTGDLWEPICTGQSVAPECCGDRMAWCELNTSGDDAFADCVWGPGFDGSTGCSPWGPPPPPRLGAHFA